MIAMDSQREVQKESFLVLKGILRTCGEPLANGSREAGGGRNGLHYHVSWG